MTKYDCLCLEMCRIALHVTQSPSHIWAILDDDLHISSLVMTQHANHSALETHVDAVLLCHDCAQPEVMRITVAFLCSNCFGHQEI